MMDRPSFALALSLLLHAALFCLSGTDSIDTSIARHLKIHAHLGESNGALPPYTANPNLNEPEKLASTPFIPKENKEVARAIKSSEQPDTSDQKSNIANDLSPAIPAFDFQPDYPLHLLSSGIRGSVSVAFNLRRTGAIENIEILESTPPGVFDKAVIDAIVAARKAAPNSQSALGKRYVIVVDFDPNGTLSQSRIPHEK